MTETPTAPGPDPAASATTTAEAPPPPPPPPPAFWPAFVRPREGRVFRGVAAGLGRATGTDPVLWRVLIVVLAIFGGSGIVLYLAGWLLFPEEGRPPSNMQRFVRGQGATTGAVVAVSALAVLAALVLLDDGLGLVPIAVVALIAYLVSRGRQQPVAAAPGSGGEVPTWAPTPAWAAAPPGGYGPPPGAVGAVPPPFPPAPPRPRSTLGLLTVSAAVLVVGTLLTAGGLGADGVTAVRVVAAALLVVGLGLLVGARWGRSRWLIALAAVLALLLGAVSAADERLDASTGERRWVVSGSAEHALGAGTAVLDLRPLSGTERRDLSVEGRVGFGELVVLVPEDLRVDLTSEVGLGKYTVVEADGTTRTEDGDRLENRTEIGPSGARNVRLEVRVGLGELEVRRVATA